jgi:trans-2,3-dihydro-3-hydroxyanthranilate isomerase
MFAPLDGVAEDPATGSANCALAALLTLKGPKLTGHFQWRIAQGVEMGRPSVLDARAEKLDGKLIGAWIGGTTVLVSEGTIEVE